MELDKKKIDAIIRAALKEDIGPADISTAAWIEKNTKIKADIMIKESGVVCGFPLAEAVFKKLGKDIKFRPQAKEGDAMHAGKVICSIEGSARPILAGERVALNFLSRLSGIATATNNFASVCRPYNVKILDTRKTTPGLRYFEKYAVRVGGGHNHRTGLWDQVLIKDNHLRAVSRQPSAVSGLLREIRRKVRKGIKIEIEASSLGEFEEALKGMPDIIMLDNFTVEDVRKAIGMRNGFKGAPLIEVSGNITLDNVEEYAKCGPDMISVGSITHSVKSLDMSMEIYG